MARARSNRGGKGAEGAAPAGRSQGRRADRHPAYRSVRASILFGAFAVGGTLADLWTKAWAFDLLSGPGDRIVVIRDRLYLTFLTNPGIVFGQTVPGWLVQVATLAAMAAVVLLFAGSERRFWSLHAALGMVLGGAAGNLYDRVLVKVPLADGTLGTGRVRDFIDVTIPVIDYNWPVFNVADMLLVVGLGIILVHVLRSRRQARP